MSCLFQPEDEFWLQHVLADSNGKPWTRKELLSILISSVEENPLLDFKRCPWSKDSDEFVKDFVAMFNTRPAFEAVPGFAFIVVGLERGGYSPIVRDPTEDAQSWGDWDSSWAMSKLNGKLATAPPKDLLFISIRLIFRKNKEATLHDRAFILAIPRRYDDPSPLFLSAPLTYAENGRRVTKYQEGTILVRTGTMTRCVSSYEEVISIGNHFSHPERLPVSAGTLLPQEALEQLMNHLQLDHGFHLGLWDFRRETILDKSDFRFAIWVWNAGRTICESENLWSNLAKALPIRLVVSLGPADLRSDQQSPMFEALSQAATPVGLTVEDSFAWDDLPDIEEGFVWLTVPFGSAKALPEAVRILNQRYLWTRQPFHHIILFDPWAEMKPNSRSKFSDHLQVAADQLQHLFCEDSPVTIISNTRGHGHRIQFPSRFTRLQPVITTPVKSLLELLEQRPPAAGGVLIAQSGTEECYVSSEELDSLKEIGVDVRTLSDSSPEDKHYLRSFLCGKVEPSLSELRAILKEIPKRSPYQPMSTSIASNVPQLHLYAPPFTGGTTLLKQLILGLDNRTVGVYVKVATHTTDVWPKLKSLLNSAKRFRVVVAIDGPAGKLPRQLEHSGALLITRYRKRCMEFANTLSTFNLDDTLNPRTEVGRFVSVMKDCFGSGSKDLKEKITHFSSFVAACQFLELECLAQLSAHKSARGYLSHHLTTLSVRARRYLVAAALHKALLTVEPSEDPGLPMGSLLTIATFGSLGFLLHRTMPTRYCFLSGSIAMATLSFCCYSEESVKEFLIKTDFTQQPSWAEEWTRSSQSTVLQPSIVSEMFKIILPFFEDDPLMGAVRGPWRRDFFTFEKKLPRGSSFPGFPEMLVHLAERRGASLHAQALAANSLCRMGRLVESVTVIRSVLKRLRASTLASCPVPDIHSIYFAISVVTSTPTGDLKLPDDLPEAVEWLRDYLKGSEHPGAAEYTKVTEEQHDRRLAVLAESLARPASSPPS